MNEGGASSYAVPIFLLSLQIQAGLSALKDALEAGFEDFKVTNTTSQLISTMLF